MLDDERTALLAQTLRREEKRQLVRDVVECPKCSAAAGEWCRGNLMGSRSSPLYGKRRANHAERYRLWLRVRDDASDHANIRKRYPST